MLNSTTIRTYLLALVMIIQHSGIHAQSGSSSKPKLIVGIVVDQMRFDHLYRYQEMYTDTGFKRLMREGFNFKNHHYNYIPTVTAAGHASIYSGATPSLHGIVGNSWYDRYAGEEVGNVEDPTVTIVGSKQ
jgi:predicted AlkP superfamily pyrophosphatase or phosphodiesterase